MIYEHIALMDYRSHIIVAYAKDDQYSLYRMVIRQIRRTCTIDTLTPFYCVAVNAL